MDNTYQVQGCIDTLLVIVIVLKGGESIGVMFFPDDVTGFLLALGYLKDLGHFIFYQLTQSYFFLYFLPNNTVYSFAHWQAAMFQKCHLNAFCFA